ncbi:MAG: DUF4003 domain-containing protein [Eubacterium sp.]|nr:DUF4003 domain-containing protein [Eubacterium sp.]
MNEKVKAKVDLFIENKEKIEKCFTFSDCMINIAASLVYTNVDKEVDVEELKACKKMIEKTTGVFSGFQSTSMPVIASKMAISNNPQQYIQDLKKVYDIISKGMWSDNGYLIQAASSIIEAGRVFETEELAVRYKDLYKKMNKEHPMITGSDDVAFAMLMVLTNKDNDSIIGEMEECYKYLRSQLKLKVGANEIQGVSEVLTLSDENVKDKCDKVINLYEAFLNQGLKYGNEYTEFSTLGTLINVDLNYRELVSEISEVEKLLKNTKGFGNWTINNKLRLMFAAILVGDVYGAIDDYDASVRAASNSAINSAVAAVVAEEVALTICMMTCISTINN